LYRNEERVHHELKNLVVADDGFALSVPTTKADFAADRSERLSLVQERLTSDKFYMRFYRVHNVHLLQRRKKRE
jgi:hypothetical protein